jgi:FkbM family methyltransferase
MAFAVMPSPEVEAKAMALVGKGEVRLAYDLLSQEQELSPRGAYYLAYCFVKSMAGPLDEGIRLFDQAEANGFTDYWLAYHRSQLLAASGNNVRALQDALTVLANNPLPETIDLALRLLASTGGAEAIETSPRIAALLLAIWTRLKQIRSQLDIIHPKIVNVDKGDFRAFAYQGDLAAAPTPHLKTLPASPVSAEQFVVSWDKSQDIILLLIAWYAAQHTDTAFLDVGSNIGTDAIRVAKFSQLINHRFPIAAFEPGIMAALVPHNLRLNAVDDMVAFEEKCVSDHSRPVILFGEPGVSVNNRIVNRNSSTEGFNKIVNAISISEYLTDVRFRDRHPILKIDTQGAEGFIWNGLRKDIPHRAFCMVLELTPWAIGATIAPKQFVGEILESFFVLDLGYDRTRAIEITSGNLDERLDDIAKRPPHWADILCISRSLPSAEPLINRIYAAYDG